MIQKFVKKYLSSLWGAATGIFVGVISLLVLLWIIPIPINEVLSGYDTSFWHTALRRAVAIILAAIVYFPLALSMIKLYSFFDKRYRVADNTVPDAIFGGLKEAGLLICTTWIFVQLLQVCLL